MNKNRKIHTAVIQMNSGENKEKNLEAALKLLHKAIDRGAQFVLLPETFNYRGESKNPIEKAENIPGPSIRPLMEIAKKSKIAILAGSIYEKTSHPKKVYNSSVLIDEKGGIKALYRKIHLFDVSLRDKKILESKIFIKGNRPILSSMFGVKIGLSICYDLRFPELYRYYAAGGAKLLCVPSSFTFMTGKAHWETLLRARAIENQCFVIAPNQCGVGQGGVMTYGNSMVVDPWGKIMARASADHDEIIYADLDFEKLAETRKSLPVLKHRRL